MSDKRCDCVGCNPVKTPGNNWLCAAHAWSLSDAAADALAKVAECERLRADAERLDWLLSRIDPVSLYHMEYSLPTGCAIDRTAIDAARKESAK